MESKKTSTTGSFGERTSRREFLALGGGYLTSVTLLGLSACSDGDEGATTSEVTLSVSPDLKNLVNKQLKAFNAEQGKNLEASVLIMPADTGQYFDQVRTQFQSGGTEMDVIAGDISWPPQFAANEWIADLSERFSEKERGEFIAGAIEGNTYQGQINGVPWFTDAGFLYYRTDLLEGAGFSEPPTTWDELKEMAAKVQTDAGVANGFVFTGANYEGGTVLGLEFIRNAGGDVLDGDEVVIASPEAIAGLEAQRSLVADGIAPEAVANFKEDEASGAFLRGDAVFMRMWPYAYGLISDPKQSKIQQSQVSLSQVPVATESTQSTNVGGGWNFFLDQSSENQDRAWELIEYLSGPEQQKQLALELGYLPTRTALYDDPEVIEALPAVGLSRETVINTTTPPVSPYYSDMSLEMSKQFNANILGETTPEETANNLQSALQSIIESAN